MNFHRAKNFSLKTNYLQILLITVALFAVFFYLNSKKITFESGEKSDEVIVASNMSWGLSFQPENSMPVANYSKDELYEHDAFYYNDNAGSRIYLTFDAGYENGHMPQILDTLKKHNVTATFFVVGSYVEEHTDLVKRMVNEGHNVANHTFNHPDMTQKSEEEFKEQLQKLEELFENMTGAQMQKFYRPPEGKFTDENLMWANELGYKTVFWSLAYVDWKVDDQPTKETAFEKLLPRTHDGAIVLLHSTSATNAQILDELILKWSDAGYTFGNLHELK